MSTIIVWSKEHASIVIDDSKEQIREGFMQVTAEVLNKEPREVIVDFQKYGNPEPENAPDVLIRAETSPGRRDKLDNWAKSLLVRWHELVGDHKLRVAVKTSVVDSVYLEAE